MPPRLDELIATVDAYTSVAQQRGIDYLTFRRLAEVIDLTAEDATRLRQQLIAAHPERYTPPLWSVRGRRAASA